MTLTITAQQRDALYAQILDRLGGIGDVWIVVRAEDFEAADRLGREYSDDLRLVLDDLGWGKGSGETVALKTPPDVLRRVFSRLRDAAIGLEDYERQERAEVRDFEERNRLVMEACREVLAGLDRGS